MDEIHVHKTKKSICAHFAESPCILQLTPQATSCVNFNFTKFHSGNSKFRKNGKVAHRSRPSPTFT